jgi:hypothetical protein
MANKNKHKNLMKNKNSTFLPNMLNFGIWAPVRTLSK